MIKWIEIIAITLQWCMVGTFIVMLWYYNHIHQVILDKMMFFYLQFGIVIKT